MLCVLSAGPLHPPSCNGKGLSTWSLKERINLLTSTPVTRFPLRSALAAFDRD